jgi:Fe-S-cluster-containing hydrogenase component 2
MGIRPYDVLTTKEAAHRELGMPDPRFMDIRGERLQDITGEPFLLPTSAITRKRVPQPRIKIARRLIKYYPYPVRQNCIRCSPCIDACPTSAISMSRKKIYFDYKRCIACFCCQETCPAQAIKVKKSLLTRLIGL